MKYSKYNISSKIKDSDNYYIVNLLSGHADIISEDEYSQFDILKKNINQTLEINQEFIDKGYFADPELEKKLYKNSYLDFLDNRDTDEIQLFLVPNYSCNFACSYCYQDEYTNPKAEISEEIVDAFFNYIKKSFIDRKKYITIFGGEPLLNTQSQKEIINYIINKAKDAKLELSLVTNGFYLSEYMDMLKSAPIREIQVTLDGLAPIHDKRRFLKNGNPTFDKIVKGIDDCLENNIIINLRMVVDKENINSLPELADFAIRKGWTSNKLFKSQIGRNYELHHCQSSASNLFTRLNLYEELYDLIKQNDHIIDFYKPAYSISRFLFENGELPHPLFDSCPACKTEWAFDYSGKIYSCTATVGKPGEELGTFYPIVDLNEERISEWQSRDITEISACKDCNVQLACGGGCGAVSKNNKGSICSSDCRPITELLELGFSSYFENNMIKQ